MASAGDYCGLGRRVLIIVQNLPVPFDRRVWQEATELTVHGYQVSIICPKGKGYEASYELLDGVHIYRHPQPFEAGGAIGYALEYTNSLLWEFALTCKVFFTRGFDVIHACNPPDNIFLIGGFFKYLFGKRFLFDHHDITPELYEAKFRRQGFFYRVMRLWERLTFAVADISIATNESYKRIATTRGGVPANKVFVVRSGPSLERMKILPAVPALKMGRQFLVAYVGVMGSQEGIEYLIEAARIIVHDLKRNDIHFTLVGGGPSLAQLKKLTETKNLADYITFTGRVPDDEMLAVLNTADICVNPDEVNPMNDQSTMNKIMEYMALGKPIVQFDVTEGRFSAGDASLYAKANDAQDFAYNIIALLADSAKREAMGKFGRARVENELAWPHEAPKLLAAYDAIFEVTHWQEKLVWYYHRLCAMSVAEILYRKVEFFKRIWDKYQGCQHAPVDRGALPVLVGLRERIIGDALSEATIKQWKSQAQDACAGNYVLLSRRWNKAISSAKWHLDPVSGDYWPRDAYCFSVNYRHAPGMGDVKYVWELNRLQYLQPLAALAYVKKDTALAAFCLSEIESWIDSNPQGRGINWASGIELALRVISILVVTSFVGEQMTQAQRAKVWGTLQAHAWQLARYPSNYSSANNHRAAEGLGLFMIGALCLQLPGAPDYKKQGWQMLCEAARTQILEDGVGAEQAIAYTQFTLELLRLGKYIAVSSNAPVPPHYTAQLALATECQSWFADAAGNSPRIGDDDEGYLLEANLSKLLWHKAVKNNPQGIRIFDKGGYTVSRYQSHNRGIMLVMDHGPLGYPGIAAHGHADALSLWLHVDGQPVLVDAGTYAYHAGGGWRRYFRSTGAHNTLSINGVDSSVMAGNFNWSHKASAKLTASQYGADSWWVEAQHSGYQKRFGTTHRRRLNVAPAVGFEIEDTLDAAESQPVEIGFLLHPELTVKQVTSGIEVCKNDRVLLYIEHTGLQTKLIEGWYSPRFGIKERTTRIVFSGILEPLQKAVTRFHFSGEK